KGPEMPSNPGRSLSPLFVGGSARKQLCGEAHPGMRGMTMRVWLVDQAGSETVGSLGRLLQQLQGRAGADLQVLGSSPFQPDLPAVLRKLLPDYLDLIVLRGGTWPVGAALQEVLGLGAALVVAASPDRYDEFRGLAEQYPVWF